MKNSKRRFAISNTLYPEPGRRFRLPRRVRLRATFAGILFLAAALAYVKYAYPDKLGQFQDWFALEARAIAHRHPFLLTELKVNTSASALEGAIRAAADIIFPVSVLDVDIGSVRDRIAALDGIVDAKVSVSDEGFLNIVADVRTPVAVWRKGRRLELVDAHGATLGSISSRAERFDLDLIAGEGAEIAVDESLEIFRASKPFERDIRGLVRIGNRRWNLELSGERKILLPEIGAVEAVEKLIVWDAAEKVFEKDFEYFDFRISGRPTVRLREPKPGEI